MTNYIAVFNADTTRLNVQQEMSATIFTTIDKAKAIIQDTYQGTLYTLQEFEEVCNWDNIDIGNSWISLIRIKEKYND